LQEKVYEEMTRIFEDSDRQPTKEDLEQMKCLDRVIKETLRLYPSASAIGRTTETDFQIGELRNAVFVSKRFSLVESSSKVTAL
jgi:cytochrome P450